MFTWICPQCGREVPPSYDECPDCSAKTAQPAAGGVAPPPPSESAPPASVREPPPAAPQAIRPTSAPQAPPVPRQSGGHMPGWLMTLLFAFAFVGLGASIYWGYNYYAGRKQAGSPLPGAMEPAGAKGGKMHPLQKYLEVSGVRFVGEKKQTQARFLLINHSEAEITNLAGSITVWARTQRSEEDAVGTIAFKVGEIGPNQSREVTAPLATKLKIYELPDWQNVTTDIQITSPPAQ
jgi:hypothetical protein